MVISRRLAELDRERVLAAILLAIAVLFNLVQLYPEVAVEVPDMNDGVLHRVTLQRVATTLAQGGQATDPWIPPVAMGYPILHYYQPLAYFPPALLHLASFKSLSLNELFDWTRYLLLSLFPLSILGSMRVFGFSRVQAAVTGLLASLLSTDLLFGFDYGSYVWGGLGMYTQLWAMLLIPPALARSWITLREGRGYLWATLALAATLLTHLLLGYLTLVSVCLLAVSSAAGGRDRSLWWIRGQRLGLLLGLVALVTAFFWIPFVLDSAYFNRSVWEEASRYDSYGLAWVLGSLVRGKLFDHGRLPVLTLLVVAGLVLCIRRGREERYRLPVLLFVFWLLLYFGRPTWGALLDLLPLGRDLRLNRAIAGVHLGGIFLAGLALALPWQWAISRRKARRLLVPLVVTTVLLFPVYRERVQYLNRNAEWMRANRAAFNDEKADYDALLQALAGSPPGRVYAGRYNNWGRGYKIGDMPLYALLNGTGLDMMGKLYHPLSLNGDVQLMFDHSRPDHYNLFNARYLVVPQERGVTDFFEAIGEFGRHRLFRAPTTGYFDLVEAGPRFAGKKQEFFAVAASWLATDLPRVKRHPVLHLDGAEEDTLPFVRALELGNEEARSEPTSAGRILSETVGQGSYEAEVELERESTLMLKVTYHPNWRARLDDEPVETMMLMPSYIGVNVPAGTHRVRLVYRPRWLRGLLLIASLLVLAAIWFFERRQRSSLAP